MEPLIWNVREMKHLRDALQVTRALDSITRESIATILKDAERLLGKLDRKLEDHAFPDSLPQKKLDQIPVITSQLRMQSPSTSLSPPSSSLHPPSRRELTPRFLRDTLRTLTSEVNELFTQPWRRRHVTRQPPAGAVISLAGSPTFEAEFAEIKGSTTVKPPSKALDFIVFLFWAIMLYLGILAMTRQIISQDKGR